MSATGAYIPTAQVYPSSVPTIAPKDSILSAGSLLLVDALYSVDAYKAFGVQSAGVPASGAAVPNIADATAKTLLGTADLASTWAALTYATSMNNATAGKLERGSLGSLHGAVKQASAITASDFANVEIPVALRTYMAANPTHHYYLSLWGWVTRPTTATNSPFPIYANLANFSAAKGWGYLPTLAVDGPASGATVDGQARLNIPAAVSTPFFTARAGTCGTTAFTAADLSAAYYRNVAMWGTGAANASAGISQNLPSWAFRRAYLEDLTVSGRTLATVSAIDQRRYVRDMATRGKFNGETFSNPATLVA